MGRSAGKTQSAKTSPCIPFGELAMLRCKVSQCTQGLLECQMILLESSGAESDECPSRAVGGDSDRSS